ncbi:tRNA pseudouridine synthase 1 [Coemansia brasiliensis]|uniref:tRNA pseudouridine synthase 1 n=1 Tax=Coemansia brasiliensis TaxID=2650707 RepID=A0A9W8M1I3_9FUNG|nr:tRNA pseudouridine synthase 1 [Coemansia brasiliensis]
MPEESTQPIAPAEATPAAAATINEETNKRKNRGQTSKERREHARKRIMIRNQERQKEEEQPRERSESSEPRRPKRKVALLIGFCGSGYQGMQVNPNAKTIEGELFKALCQAGAVSAENSTDQGKIQLQRAARTDKGVHAAGQVVSLKMIVEEPDIISKLNKHLPAQIRAWDFVRVVRSFNAKTACDSRVYEYMLPTYVFMPPSEKCMEVAKNVKFDERQVPETTEEEIRAKREYRVSAEMLEYVRKAFEKYQGTHDYRNFTVTKGCTANNSKRHIHWFTVSDPMIIQGCEWLSLKVKGQSFMLHQIRKMVGLIILMARTNVPLRLIDVIFDCARINVPKAPGLGLLLERPVFDGYNRRVSSQKLATSNQVTFEPYQKEIDAFKQKYIYDNITETEMKEAVFDIWVKNTEVFPEQYLYINQDCVIPESTLVVPGEESIRPPPQSIGKDKDALSSEDEEDTKDD